MAAAAGRKQTGWTGRGKRHSHPSDYPETTLTLILWKRKSCGKCPPKLPVRWVPGPGQPCPLPGEGLAAMSRSCSWNNFTDPYSWMHGGGLCLMRCFGLEANTYSYLLLYFLCSTVKCFFFFPDVAVKCQTWSYSCYEQIFFQLPVGLASVDRKSSNTAVRSSFTSQTFSTFQQVSSLIPQINTFPFWPKQQRIQNNF